MATEQGQNQPGEMFVLLVCPCCDAKARISIPTGRASKWRCEKCQNPLVVKHYHIDGNRSRIVVVADDGSVEGQVEAIYGVRYRPRLSPTL